MASVYITYMCGHTEKAYFEGSVKAATRKAEYVGERKLCPECLEKEREKERELAEAAAKKEGLPDLDGTEKQVNWAVTIRNKILSGKPDAMQNKEFPIIGFAEDKYFELDEAASKDIEEAAIRTIDSASFWIDIRLSNQVTRDLICKYIEIKGVKMISKYTLDDYQKKTDDVQKKWYPACIKIVIGNDWEYLCVGDWISKKYPHGYIEHVKDGICVTGDFTRSVKNLCEENNFIIEVENDKKCIIRMDNNDVNNVVQLIGDTLLNYFTSHILFFDTKECRDRAYERYLSRIDKKQKEEKFKEEHPNRIEISRDKEHLVILTGEYERRRSEELKALCNKTYGAAYNWRNSNFPIAEYEAVLKFADKYDYTVTSSTAKAIENAKDGIDADKEYVRKNYTECFFPYKLVETYPELKAAVKLTGKEDKDSLRTDILVKNDFNNPKISLSYESRMVSHIDAREWNKTHELCEQLIIEPKGFGQHDDYALFPGNLQFKTVEMEYRDYIKWNETCAPEHKLLLKKSYYHARLVEVYALPECDIKVDPYRIQQLKERGDKIRDVMNGTVDEVVLSTPSVIDADALEVEVPECLKN